VRTARSRASVIANECADTKLADRLAESHNPTVSQVEGQPASTATDAAELAALREQLSAAQTSREALMQEISQLHSLESKQKTLGDQMRRREKEIELLTRKLRDRNEEVKQGRKLRDEVQDEYVAMELQINMLEEKNKRLEAENRELVDRWMKKKAEEAEEMNRASRW
jgi:chromosome segregation ATPase